MKLIPLTRGLFAMVDDADFDKLSGYKWCAHLDPRSGRNYAVTTIYKPRKRTIQMHRLILGHNAPRTDHRDGNGLNNQRANLRPASHVQNGQNRKIQNHSAPFKGVTFCKGYRRPWQSHIRVNKRAIHLGYFKTAKEAANAYDRAALLHFGDFARTNQQIGVA